MITKHKPCRKCGYLTLSVVEYCVLCQAYLATVEERTTEEMSDWEMVKDWRSRINEHGLVKPPRWVKK